MNLQIEKLPKEVLERAEIIGNVLDEIKKKNNILRLVASLVEGDAGFESDCVALDVLNNRPVSEREKTLAELVSKIYKIVHPLFSTCSHPDWENETEKMIKLTLTP